MPPRTRIPARREASGEFASQPHDPLQRGRGHGRGRQGVNVGRHGSATGVANAEVLRARQGNLGMTEIIAGLQGVRQVDQHLVARAGGIEVTLAEFMKLKPPTFSGSNASEDPQRFIYGLERLWRALGCSDIRAMELASFQLEEEMRVKRFVRGLRKYIFRSVVGSNCSTFSEVLSLALQLEQRKKKKGGSGQDSRKKQRVEGSQSSHPSVGVGSVLSYQVQKSGITEG
ncbi:hypothetical protein SESBI_39238 [Sesbania bispinosa]|nr:hypothetical protein SESBI_39238 [Sesbania bispinosa]